MVKHTARRLGVQQFVWRFCLGVRCTARTGCRRGRIAVMVTHPRHLVGYISFIAALRGKIQQVVGAHHHLYAAPVGRIGVKDRAGVILIEDADAGHFFIGVLRVVVIALAVGDFFRGASTWDLLNRVDFTSQPPS